MTPRMLAAGIMLVVGVASLSGQVVVRDPFLLIRAGARDPLFTTYAAPMSRSRFFAAASDPVEDRHELRVFATTALPAGRSQWITGPAARADGHAWRARAGVVLTGIGTVRDDDPSLDVRDEIETAVALHWGRVSPAEIEALAHRPLV